MNTVTLPRNKYTQIINTQEKLRGDIDRLQKIITHIAQDEVTAAYTTKLSKIEKGLSSGKGVAFKNKGGIKKFFQTL